MIKLFIGLFILMSIYAQAQTTLFFENFEITPLSMTSSGSAQWARTSKLASSGIYSDSAALIGGNDSAILSTNTLSTAGNPYVFLEFDHICKLEYFDMGIVEVSVNNGASWIQLTGNEYLGNAQFANNGNRFNSVSYPLDWLPANNNAIPTNSWWKHEQFNISNLAGNISQLKVRFKLKDGNGSGGAGNYGWLLDNIKITMSAAELIPPMIVMVNPVLNDSAFGTGPYPVKADISDLSGVDTSIIIYTIGSVTDTVGMTLLSGGTIYNGEIPQCFINTQVSYKVVAFDNSTNHNIAVSSVYNFIVYPEQKFIQVGYSNNSSFTSPIYNGTIISTDTISDHVSLFTAQELQGNFGIISKLEWFKGSQTVYSGVGELQIFLKATNDVTVSTTSTSIPGLLSGATLVYQNNSLVLPSTMGFIGFNTTLNNFLYDGNSNLYVIVRWVRKGTLSSNYIDWAYTYTAGKSISYKGTTANPPSPIGNGNRPNTRIFFTDPISTYDAGIKEILSPDPVILSTQITPIKVRIKNGGSALLTKANVQYTIDGIAQTSYSWTGSLATNFNSNEITLGSYNFNLGTHNLKIWTSAPNDSLDQYNLNDTMNMSFFACNYLLSGDYTIGGSTADFADFDDAMTALKNCGIVGPVVFHINPGTYYVDLTFDNNIPGIDSLKTIKFVSATKKAQDVILFNGNSNNAYVVGFSNAKYITLSNLTIDARTTNTTKGIYIESGSNHITIDSCSVFSYSSASILHYPIDLYGYNTFIGITNSYIDGGYCALNIGQTSQNIGHTILIENNYITGFERNGVDIYYFLNAKVNRNKIRKGYQANGSTLIGLALSYCDNLECVGNDIVMNPYYASYGIHIDYGTTTNGGQRLVANNMVLLQGTSTSTSFRALYSQYANNVNYYNNTFITYAGSSNAEAGYIEGTGSGLYFKNNIFSNFGGAYAFEKTSTSIVSGMDYNSYYTTGGIIMNWGASQISKASGVAGIIAVTQMDSNSIITNPLIFSQSNGHGFSPVIDGAGLPLTSVLTDFDGQPRDANNPDIGADEFSISTIDLSLIAINNPFPVDTQNRVSNVAIEVVNTGSDTINSFHLKYKVNQIALIDYVWSGTLLPTQVDTIFPGTFTVAAGQNQFLVYSSITADTLNLNDTLKMNFVGLPSIDAEIKTLDAPFDGCAKSTTESVKITIQNNGLQNITSGLTASYKINGGMPITENVTTTIAAGQNYQFIFSTKVNMAVTTVDSVFDFKIWLNHANDPIKTNDSIQVTVVSVSYLPSPIVSDTTINYGSPVTLIAQSNLPIQWFANQTSTNALWNDSAFTTPNLFDTTTYWARANTNIPSYTAVVGIQSNTNDFFTNVPYGGGGQQGKFQLLFTAAELTAAGLNAGPINSIAMELAVGPSVLGNMQISIGNTNISTLSTAFENPSFTTVFNSPVNAVTGWNTHSFSTTYNWDGVSNLIVQICTQGINNFAPPTYYSVTTNNSIIRLAGFGTSCTSTTGQVGNARPNMKFTTLGTAGCSSLKIPVTVNVPKPLKDGLVTKIKSPATGCGLAATPVIINIFNNGTDTVPSGYSLTYKINSGNYITPEIINIPIPPGDTIAYTFNTIAALTPGINGNKYIVTAKTIVPNDGYLGNDSLTTDTIFSHYTPTNPIVSGSTIPYGTSTQLTGLASDTIYWYSDINGSKLVGKGKPFQTSPLFDTTNYFAQARRTIFQNNYSVGTSTLVSGAAGPSPYGSSQYGSKSQFIIKSQELKALGMIEGYIYSLAFEVSQVKGTVLNDYTVKIGSTTETDLNKSTFIKNLQTVFNTPGFIDVFGWNVHQFNTPYYWDGQSNLVIETCFNGIASYGFSGIKYTNTTFISSANATGLSNFSCNDSNIMTTYNQRPNIRLNQTGYGFCGSDLMPLTINVSNFPGIDAGIEALLLPSSSASSIVADTVQVIIKNFGLNNLTSAQIRWSENGLNQTNYNWTGNLAHGMTDTVNISTSFMFDGGITTLKAWTLVPNDSIYTNDTATSQMNICMSGSYLIAATNGRFSSIAEAIQNINIAGVCGPTIIELDSGTYTGQYEILPISGASAVNTVTFRSADLDSSYVTIMATTSQNFNYIFKLKGAGYVNLTHLGIISNSSTYSNVIVLENSAHDIRISNCKLTSSLTTTGFASNISANLAAASNIFIENNHLYNGLKSIDLSGSTTNKNDGIYIKNNIIENFSSHAIYAYYIEDLVFSDNIVFATNSTTLYGIYGYYIQNGCKFERNKITLSGSSSGYGFYLNITGTPSNRCLIANNFVSITSGTQSRYGIYITSSSYSDVVYNSVHTLFGGTTSYGLYLGNITNFKVLNNNIYAQSGYGVYTNSSNGFIEFDYNNIFDSPYATTYVYWGAGQIANLALLKQFNPLQNQNSIDYNPEFVSSTDLHCQQIHLYNAGISVAGITTDIDGDLRHAATPSIGADQFTPPNIDLGITELVYPTQSDCGYTSSDSIVIRLGNYGISNINFALQPTTLTTIINGINPDTINLVLNSGTLNSADDTVIVITNTYNFSINGLYEITPSVIILNDSNSVNDAISPVVIASYPVIDSFPFNEGFESGYNTSFKTSQGIEADIDVNGNSTSLGNYSLHFQGGLYSNWFTPANVTAAFGNNAAHVAKAYTCEVDASTLAFLSLKLDLRQTAYDLTNLNTNSWFRVMLTDSIGTHYLKNMNGDSVFKPLSVNSDPFITQIFNLNAYAGQTFQISMEASNRYSYGTGASDGDNAFVDNFTLWSPTSTDATITEVKSDNLIGPVGQSKTIKILVTNLGNDTLTQIPVGYIANGGPVVRDTMNISLYPSQADSFTFAVPFNLNINTNYIKAFTSVQGDLLPLNDTMTLTMKGLQNITVDYIDNFETNNLWFGTGTQNQWILGTPSKPNINGAHSGTKAWTTSLNNNYTSNTIEYLYSPYITIPTWSDTALVEFYHFMRVYSGYAYGTLEFSLNGTQWSSIGYMTDPMATNWYNMNINGKHVWSNSNTQWLKSSIKLDPSVFNTGTQFQLRFAFIAEPYGVTDEGWAIDDFSITIPQVAKDAGILSISNPINQIIAGSLNTVTVSIKNFGTDTLYNIPVSYYYAGNTINETWTGVLLPDSIVNYSFINSFVAPSAGSISFCSKTMLPGDLKANNNETCLNITLGAAALDAKISTIISPAGQTTISSNVDVRVMIANKGTSTLTQVPVGYQIGATLINEIYNGQIFPGDSAIYDFTGTFVSPVGVYKLSSFTSLPNDAVKANDTLSILVVGSALGNVDKNQFIVGQNEPNPFEGLTFIPFYLPNPGQVYFRLSTIEGKEVYSFTQNYDAGAQRIKVDSDKLERGVYYYSMTYKGQKITKRFIVL